MTLVLRSIEHGFGAQKVLDRVTFAVAPGEVHALLGMNGAGKSTLLHLAAGVYIPQGGTVEIDRRPVAFRSPKEAAAAGIVFLTQEVDRGLVPALTVHENLTVGLLKDERRIGFSRRTNRLRAREMLRRFGLDWNVNRPVASLSIYEKQMLSIVRAVAGQAKYLLLDEPTASFDRKEAERFGQLIEELKRQGIGIVFVSHRMNEIFALSDRISVLRGGKLVLERKTGQTTLEEVVAAMTGGEASIRRRPYKEFEGPEQFAVRGLPLDPDAPGIGLGLKPGEIVVGFGLLGSGKTRLARALFGASKPYRALICGNERLIRGTRGAARQGLAFVPEERGKQGIWKRYDIRTHLALSFRGWIFKSREIAYARELIGAFAISPAIPSYKAGALSGGNQQKVAIAKWFARKPVLAIFDEPMKGIDVAAKETIFRMIESLADQGASILYLTAEPDDALRIADRIFVLSRRRIVAWMSSDKATAEMLLSVAERGEQPSGGN
jgi:simple sugar transport system ATP-binding protein